VGFLEFFTDPVLMAPTIGCMLMCLVGAVVGTFSVLRKQALVGEMLSHACYPGVVLALALIGSAFEAVAMAGAFLSCIAGMVLVEFLQKKYKVSSDAALCFVLASFFGIGLTVLTALQQGMPLLYKQLQSYLFGQAATMTSDHLWLYAMLSITILLFVLIFYRLIQVTIFDPEYATVLGMNIPFAKMLLLILTVASVCVGIRSVGVVLMSSMLIFPSVTARFWTHKLVPLLFLSAFFGLLAGFLGVYFSHIWSVQFAVSIPTGPTIVIVSGLFFLFSCFFAPQRGLVMRLFRVILFMNRCKQENVLKALYKTGKTRFTQDELCKIFHASKANFHFFLCQLVRKGRIRRIPSNTYELTSSGLLWGRKIVRLHRLWEVYLVECCGVSKDRVHPSAEEMEHIITPEIESELEIILHHPRFDPHHQPIPPHEGLNKGQAGAL
jgi:manganese/zinc/iron transport system permease protein